MTRSLSRPAHRRWRRREGGERERGSKCTGWYGGVATTRAGRCAGARRPSPAAAADVQPTLAGRPACRTTGPAGSIARARAHTRAFVGQHVDRLLVLHLLACDCFHQCAHALQHARAQQARQRAAGDGGCVSGRGAGVTAGATTVRRSTLRSCARRHAPLQVAGALRLRRSRRRRGRRRHGIAGSDACHAASAAASAAACMASVVIIVIVSGIGAGVGSGVVPDSKHRGRLLARVRQPATATSNPGRDGGAAVARVQSPRRRRGRRDHRRWRLGPCPCRRRLRLSAHLRQPGRRRLWGGRLSAAALQALHHADGSKLLQHLLRG